MTDKDSYSLCCICPASSIPESQTPGLLLDECDWKYAGLSSIALLFQQYRGWAPGLVRVTRVLCAVLACKNEGAEASHPRGTAKSPEEDSALRICDIQVSRYTHGGWRP